VGVFFYKKYYKIFINHKRHKRIFKINMKVSQLIKEHKIENPIFSTIICLNYFSLLNNPRKTFVPFVVLNYTKFKKS